MSDLLNLGSGAIRAYRGAMETIGNNVANSQTDGYSRRAIRLSEYRPSTNMDVGYQSTGGGYGVRVDGVARAWDAYAAHEMRIATADAAGADARATWLSSVELALGNGGRTVGDALTGVFSSATALAADPQSIAQRTIFISALDNAATQFRRTGAALDRIAPAVVEAATVAVGEVNAALAQLHSTNRALAVAGDGTSVRAALEDERDTALAALSRNVAITTSYDQRGAVAVMMAGSNRTLIDATGPDLVTLTAAADGRFVVSANGGVITPTAGAIAALIDIAQNVAQRRVNLDVLAADVVTTINGWATGGTDRTGAAGTALLSGTGAASVMVTTTDPLRVPAGQSGQAANANLIALGALRTISDVEGRWAAMQTDTATMVFGADADRTATAQLRDNRIAALDATNGVDLDTEAAELVRYQQAYGAATRVVQVARETINAIFAIF